MSTSDAVELSMTSRRSPTSWLLAWNFWIRCSASLAETSRLVSPASSRKRVAFLPVLIWIWASRVRVWASSRSWVARLFWA